MARKKDKTINQNPVNSAGSARHSQRQVSPPPRPCANPRADGQLLAVTIHHLWPWRLREYPGWMECASQTLRYGRDTIRRFLHRGAYPVSPRLARTMASLLRSRAATELDLAARWDALAAQRQAEIEANPPSWFRRVAMDQSQGWRSGAKVRRTPR